MQIRLSDHFTYAKLLRFVAPTVVMMVFISIYGVVDGFFVSNHVGKIPFASLNLVMPFVMILGGMGFMVGTGGTALVAKELGRGNRETANRYFSMMVLFTFLFGVVLAVAGLLLIRPISIFLGATPQMLDDCVLYGRIVVAFTPAFMLQSVFHSFLTAAEKPRLGLAVTVAAGCTNIVLDALFIAGFGWGLAGAAVATGIGQCVGGILPLFYFFRKNSSLLRLRYFRLQLAPILAACGNGSSELMSNISSSIVGVLYNFQLLRLFAEDGVAAYGVLMYVNFIFVAIFIGYTIGTAPIVSYHYGAENSAELKNILRKSVRLMMGTGILLCGLALVLAGPLSSIFVGYDDGLLSLTTRAMRLFALSFVLAGFNIFSSGFFTALNNGGVSAIISFLRTLVFQSSAVILLPFLFGADAVFGAVAVAELFAFLLSLGFLFAKRRKYQYM